MGLEAGGFSIDAVSSVHRSAPEGHPGQPDFLNAVVVGEWRETPHALLALAHRLEAAAGRRRPFPGAPRTLDVDLILLEGVRLSDATLTLPHPRWRNRAFVLAPLAEAAPTWPDPQGGGTVADLWRRRRAALPDIESIAPPRRLWSPTP
jgi:2-amino-4-hydroxy-6-hydroxymethyldihydropteridine diphosphokinase